MATTCRRRANLEVGLDDCLLSPRSDLDTELPATGHEPEHRRGNSPFDISVEREMELDTVDAVRDPEHAASLTAMEGSSAPVLYSASVVHPIANEIIGPHAVNDEEAILWEGAPLGCRPVLHDPES